MLDGSGQTFPKKLQLQIDFQRAIIKKDLLIYLDGILFLPKLFWPTVRTNCFYVLKFEAAGREFAKFLIH